MEQGNRIDLKSRIKENQNVTNWVSFTTHKLSEKSLDEMAAISMLLDKVGVSLEISRNNNTETGTAYDFIVLKINDEEYKKVTTRHAGRKANFNNKYDKYGKCTVAELKKKLESMTKTKIAEELGCSRMTLYRIIRNIEVMMPEENMSIWHFTS